MICIFVNRSIHVWFWFRAVTWAEAQFVSRKSFRVALVHIILHIMPRAHVTPFIQFMYIAPRMYFVCVCQLK